MPPFVIHSCMLVSIRHLDLLSQFVVNGRENLKLKSMDDIMTWCFPIWYFLEYCHLWVKVYVHFQVFFTSLVFFYYDVYPFSISLCSLCSHVLLQISFVSFASSFFFPWVFSVTLKVETYFVTLEGPVFVVSLHAVSKCSEFSFISFWFSSFSKCIVTLVYCWLFLLFSFHWIALYFSNSYACRNFNIWNSHLISYPGFVFLFEFLWGTQIL